MKGNKFIEYTLSATNHGPDSLGGVEQHDQIPFGTTLVSTGEGCNLIGNEVRCDEEPHDANETRHHFFTVEVTCKKCSSISNTVIIDYTQNAYEYPYDNAWNILTPIKGKF